MPTPHLSEKKQIRWVILALLTITWLTLLLQLAIAQQTAYENGKSVFEGLMDYFGFFSILTNLLVALILTFMLRSGNGSLRKCFTHPQVMGCAATSIVMVGLGYHFLLREVWKPQGLQWLSDIILHYVSPLCFCIIWLFYQPKSRLPLWSPLAWLSYPVIYFIYALIRGIILGSYPYPFINVTEIGYPTAIRNAIGLFIIFVATGYLLLIAKRKCGRPSQTTIINAED